MSAETTTPGRSVLARRRAWAWTGLAALAGFVIAVAAVVVRSRQSLIGLVLAGVLDLLLAAAALWWAFTTRKVWKRWLNLALMVLVVVAFVAGLVVFSLWNAAGMLAIGVTGFVYGLAARPGAHRRRAGRHSGPRSHAAGPAVAAGQSQVRRWHGRPGRPRGSRPRPWCQRA